MYEIDSHLEKNSVSTQKDLCEKTPQKLSRQTPILPKKKTIK